MPKYVHKELGEKRILIVDSHANLRGMAKGVLRGVGFINVDDRKDGKDAFTFLQKNRMNLVITDLDMLNMDGIELVKAIRSDPELKNTPILLVTDSVDRNKMKAAIAAGINDVLAKPYKSGVFLNKVVKNIR